MQKQALAFSLELKFLRSQSHFADSPVRISRVDLSLDRFTFPASGHHSIIRLFGEVAWTAIRTAIRPSPGEASLDVVETKRKWAHPNKHETQHRTNRRAAYGSSWNAEGLAGGRVRAYTKTRNYRWNVTGPHCNDLHKFFESQYETLDGKIDEIAEFIRALGKKSTGSLAQFLSSTRLKEEPIAATQMFNDLLANHEAVIHQLRLDVAAAGDQFQAADVADFLSSLREDHEKMAWMLRSILE